MCWSVAFSTGCRQAQTKASKLIASHLGHHPTGLPVVRTVVADLNLAKPATGNEFTPEPLRLGCRNAATQQIGWGEAVVSWASATGAGQSLLHADQGQALSGRQRLGSPDFWVTHRQPLLLRSRANAGKRCMRMAPLRPDALAGRGASTPPAALLLRPIAQSRSRLDPTVPLVPHISTGQPDLSRATFASSCESARNASGGAGRIRPQVRLARAMRARYPMRTPQAATECLFGLACPPGA